MKLIYNLFYVIGIIYLIGGRNELGYDLDSLTSYNPISQRLTTLRPMNYAASFCAVVVIDETIYVIGGARDNQCLNNVCCYSIRNVSLCVSSTMISFNTNMADFQCMYRCPW